MNYKIYFALYLMAILFQSCGNDSHATIIPSGVRSIIIVDKRDLQFDDTVILAERKTINEIVQQLNNSSPAIVKFVPDFELYLVYSNNTKLVMINHKHLVCDSGRKYTMKTGIEPIIKHYFKH